MPFSPRTATGTPTGESWEDRGTVGGGHGARASAAGGLAVADHRLAARPVAWANDSGHEHASPGWLRLDDADGATGAAQSAHRGPAGGRRRTGAVCPHPAVPFSGRSGALSDEGEGVVAVAGEWHKPLKGVSQPPKGPGDTGAPRPQNQAPTCPATHPERASAAKLLSKVVDAAEDSAGTVRQKTGSPMWTT